MKKSLVNIFVFLFLGLNMIHAQQNKELERIDSLIEVGEYQQVLLLTDKIMGTRPRNFMKSQVKFRLSKLYTAMQLFDNARQNNQESLDLKNRIAYEFVADNYWMFGQLDYLEGKYESALEYFNEAKDLPHEDIRFSGILEGSIGLVYQKMGKLEKAEGFLLNALEILSWELDSTAPELLTANFNLGVHYAMQDSRTTAWKYFKAALPIASIQSKLNAKESFIQYFKSGDQCYTFVINKEGNHNQLLEVEERFSSGEILVKLEKSKFVESSFQAYQQLFLPIKGYMQNKETLYISDNVDAKPFPFEALIQREPNGKIRYKKLNYLLRDYKIHHCRTAQAFLNSEYLTDYPMAILNQRWMVSEQAKKRIHQLYARYKKKGLDAGNALRKAKFKMLKRSKTASPEVWGSFFN